MGRRVCYTVRMSRIVSLLPAVLLSCLAIRLPAQSATSAPLTGQFVDGTAAVVNGESISFQEVLDLLRASLPPGAPPPDAEFRSVYPTILEEAIRTRLVLQEYESGDIRIPDWVLDSEISEVIDSQYGGDRSRLLAELSERRMTYEQWRRNREKSIIVTLMRQQNVAKNIHVGPAEIRRHYLDHPEEYTRPAGTHLLLILLKPASNESPEQFRARVADIRSRLDREPFGEIARFFSADPSHTKGGDWGWIQPDMLRSELAEALSSLAVGETSAPIETSSGIYILHKEGERGDGLQPLESVRDEIAALLRRRETERLFGEWTKRLRDKAQVRILIPSL